MTDQQAREFVERLAVPYRVQPPACPCCGARHQLEVRCADLPLQAVSTTAVPAEHAS